MAATKTVKPRIKVEEIEEEKPVAVETPIEVKKESPAKISSFSQLDVDKPAELPEDDKPMAPDTKETLQDVSSTTEEEMEAVPAVTNDEDNPEKMSSDDVKQWLKDIRPDTTKEVEKSGGGFNLKIFFVFLLAFAVIGALIGGLIYYKQKVSSPKMVADVSPTPVEATPAPTATPAAMVDISKLKLNILNGSGIKGEAGKVETLLTKAGFTEDNISTGNANTYDYKTTSVALKKGVPDVVFDKVKSALGSGYDVVKGVGTVKDTSSFDVEIIVGKKS